MANYVLQFNPPAPDRNLVNHLHLAISLDGGTPVIQDINAFETQSRTFSGEPGQRVHVEAYYTDYSSPPRRSPGTTVFDGVLPDASGNATPNVPALGPVTYTA